MNILEAMKAAHPFVTDDAARAALGDAIEDAFKDFMEQE